MKRIIADADEAEEAIMPVRNFLSSIRPMADGGWSGYGALDGRVLLLFMDVKGAQGLVTSYRELPVGPPTRRILHDLDPYIGVYTGHFSPPQMLGRLSTYNPKPTVS